MAPTSALIRPLPPVPVAARRRWTGWPLLVLAGWLVQGGLRLYLAHGQQVPAAYPDETGYLVAARWLSGGPGGDLSGCTFYKAGYPLLLTPAFWLSHDPGTCYRIVVGIGTAVSAGVFPLGVLALRRMGLGRAVAYALAFAAALLPAGVIFTPFALTDAILPTVVLGWLLALHTFLRSHSALAPAPVANPARAPARVLVRRPAGTSAGVVASLMAVYAYAVHARGAVVLVAHLAIMVLLLYRRPRGSVLVATAVAVTGATAAWALDRALLHALYPRGARDLGGILMSRLTTPSGLAWTIFGAAGQVWYLVVSTWGLAGLGLAAAGAALVARRTPYVSRIMAGVLVATTLGIALASSAALPDEHRVGNFLYGRYLACLAVAHALVGLAVLARRRSLPVYAIVAGIILAGAGLSAVAYAGDRINTYTFIGFDFPETSFLTWDWSGLRVGTASLVALGLLAVLTTLATITRAVVPIAVALAVFDLVAVVVISRPWAPDRQAIFEPRPARGAVVIDRRVPWQVWVRQEYQVWWTHVTFTDLSREGPPAGACLAITTRTENIVPPPGWRIAAIEPTWVAWSADVCHRAVK